MPSHMKFSCEDFFKLSPPTRPQGGMSWAQPRFQACELCAAALPSVWWAGGRPCSLGDAEPFWMPVHQSMRVTITRNIDKEHGFVNGMGATVQCMRRSGVQVLTDHGQVLLVHPVTHEPCR